MERFPRTSLTFSPPAALGFTKLDILPKKKHLALTQTQPIQEVQRQIMMISTQIQDGISLIYGRLPDSHILTADVSLAELPMTSR